MLADKQRGKGTFDAYSLPSSSFCLTHATRLYSRPLPRMSPSRFSSYLPMCCHADPPRAFISYAAPLSLLHPRKSRQSKALAALLFFSLPLRQLTPPSFSSPTLSLHRELRFFVVTSILSLSSPAPLWQRRVSQKRRPRLGGVCRTAPRSQTVDASRHTPLQVSQYAPRRPHSRTSSHSPNTVVGRSDAAILRQRRRFCVSVWDSTPRYKAAEGSTPRYYIPAVFGRTRMRGPPGLMCYESRSPRRR